MKATGIVRRIDDLGRVVIPKEIRRTMRIREGDPLEIYTTREGEVIFKKYSLIGGLEDFAAQFCDTLSRSTPFTAAVTDARGAEFTDRHIRRRDGRLYADLVGMNRELLLDAGLTDAQIDVSPCCTACNPVLFHSHRASRGQRGAMSAMIGILPD